MQTSDLEEYGEFIYKKKMVKTVPDLIGRNGVL